MFKKITLFILSVVLIFSFFGCTKNETSADKTEKNIIVEIIAKEKTETINITTLADNLGDALTEKNLISGTKGQYGLFVKSVNGITADEKNEEWWCFTKGDEQLFTGVDSVKISDGDLYKITLKKGY